MGPGQPEDLGAGRPVELPAHAAGAHRQLVPERHHRQRRRRRAELLQVAIERAGREHAVRIAEVAVERHVAPAGHPDLVDRLAVDLEVKVPEHRLELGQADRGGAGGRGDLAGVRRGDVADIRGISRGRRRRVAQHARAALEPLVARQRGRAHRHPGQPAVRVGGALERQHHRLGDLDGVELQRTGDLHHLGVALEPDNLDVEAAAGGLVEQLDAERQVRGVERALERGRPGRGRADPDPVDVARHTGVGIDRQHELARLGARRGGREREPEPEPDREEAGPGSRRRHLCPSGSSGMIRKLRFWNVRPGRPTCWLIAELVGLVPAGVQLAFAVSA